MPKGFVRPSVLSLDGGAGDEEPLVVDTVDWCRLELLVPLDLAGAGFFTVLGVRNSDVGAGLGLAHIVRHALAGRCTERFHHF